MRLMWNVTEKKLNLTVCYTILSTNTLYAYKNKARIVLCYLIWVEKLSDNFILTANIISIVIHVHEANHASHFSHFQLKLLKFVFIINLKYLGNTRQKQQ